MEEGNRTIYYALNAREVVDKYLQKEKFTKISYLLSVFLIFVWTCIAPGELALKLICEAFALVVVGALRTLVQVYYLKSMNNILYEDCDPQKMYEVLRLLDAKKRKKEDRYTLYMVLAQSCCYLDGKEEEGFSYLQKIGRKKLICRSKIIYFLSCANYAYIQRDREQFRGTMDELERMSFDGKMSKANKELYQDVKRMIRAIECMWDENDIEARSLFNKALMGEKIKINIVCLHTYLAKLDIKEADYVSAKMHLEYVIKHGNTMKAVGEAKEMLEQMC